MPFQCMVLKTWIQYDQYSIPFHVLSEQASAFYSGDADNPEDRREEYQETLLHLFSLLHAVALQHLRGDWDLNNLHAMQSTDSPPPVVSLLPAHTYLRRPPLSAVRVTCAGFFHL